MSALKRNALVTEAAYAVLQEIKRGDAKWEVKRPKPGMVQLELDSDNYDGLVAICRKEDLSTISEAIIHLYKQGHGR